MKEKFIAISNVLSMIETKGEQTIMMADCLKFIAQCIRECEEIEQAEMAKQDKEDSVTAE